MLVAATVALGVLVHRVRALRGPVLGLAAVMLTIPSLALFAVPDGDGWRDITAAEFEEFYKAKIGTATYFAQHVIPEANSYRDAIVGGSESVLALEEALF